MRENLATREEWEHTLRTTKKHDKRIKLTDEERAEIKRLYFQKNEPIREIARIFEKRCSRRMIQFILFPERLHANNYPGHWKKYYDKDKQRVHMRVHREHLKDLRRRKEI